MAGWGILKAPRIRLWLESQARSLLGRATQPPVGWRDRDRFNIGNHRARDGREFGKGRLRTADPPHPSQPPTSSRGASGRISNRENIETDATDARGARKGRWPSKNREKHLENPSRTRAWREAVIDRRRQKTVGPRAGRRTGQTAAAPGGSTRFIILTARRGGRGGVRPKPSSAHAIQSLAVPALPFTPQHRKQRSLRI